jgi:hypothetical protein
MTYYRSSQQHIHTLSHLVEEHPYLSTVHEALSKSIMTLTEHSLTFSHAYVKMGENSRRCYLSYHIPELSLKDAFRSSRLLTRHFALPLSTQSLTSLSVESDWHEEGIGPEDEWIIYLTVGTTVLVN